MVALQRAAGHASRPTARTTTLLGVPEDQGGYAGDPVLGVVKQLDLGALQQPAEIYVGLLAATILFIATNAGIIGVSRLVYSMGLHRQLPDRLRQLHPQLRHAVDRDPRLRGDRVRDDDPRPGRVPGQHVRVRGDAVVHDRARLGHRACASDTRTSSARGPGPGNIPFRGYDAAAVRGRRRHRHGPRVRRRHGRCYVDVALARHRLAARSACVVYVVLPAPPGARPDLDGARSRSRARSSTTRPSTSRSSSRWTASTYPEGAMATGDQGRGAAAARHPRARHHPGARRRRRSTPSCPSSSAARRRIIEQAQAAGRAARDRPLGEGARGRRRAG